MDSAQPHKRPIRILVVEDDLDIREAVEELLTLEGLAVTTARDGEDALAVIDAAEPDLVLVDLMMPRIGGAELIQRLRAGRHPNVPIAVLTASPGDVPTGANVMLKKPFDPDVLLSVIRQFFETGTPR